MLNGGPWLAAAVAQLDLDGDLAIRLTDRFPPDLPTDADGDVEHGDVLTQADVAIVVVPALPEGARPIKVPS